MSGVINVFTLLPAGRRIACLLEDTSHTRTGVRYELEVLRCTV